MAHRRKRSVSFTPELDERIEAAAVAEGLTVSAWLARCAEDRLINAEGLKALAEYDELFGAPSESALEAADRQIDEAVEAAASAYQRLGHRGRGAA